MIYFQLHGFELAATLLIITLYRDQFITDHASIEF